MIRPIRSLIGGLAVSAAAMTLASPADPAAQRPVNSSSSGRPPRPPNAPRPRAGSLRRGAACEV